MHHAGKTTVLDTDDNATFMPFDINDSGSVAGMMIRSGGRMVGFVWSDRKPRELQLPKDRKGGLVTAINNSGAVVGWTFYSKIGRHACVWKEGVPLELPTPVNTQSEAWDINDNGTIVGCYKDAKGNQKVVKWKIAK
jgi:uncharacterized membrane protein